MNFQSGLPISYDLPDQQRKPRRCDAAGGVGVYKSNKTIEQQLLEVSTIRRERRGKSKRREK